MRHYKFLIITLFLLLQTACIVGPRYVKPYVNVPVDFKEARRLPLLGAKEKAKYWKRAEPCDQFYRGEWWKIFHDAKLDKLERQLNRSNQSIETAYQNYRQARALVAAAHAAFFPTVDGGLNLARQGQGSSSSTASGSSVGWFAEASWELDLWGSIRHNVEAAMAAAQSSAALLESTRLSLQASLAQYYFQLRGLDTDQVLLDRTVADYQASLKLTQNRYASGVAQRSDVVQAQGQLETTKALAINNGVLRAQYEHAIAVLMGIPPAQFTLVQHPLSVTLPSIPLLLPSQLLERRPDIAQAERAVAQANAQVGVAEAAYFPTLTLSGTSNIANSLFSFSILDWSLSAQLVETLFDGGLRNANFQAAWTNYCASVASYRQVVLTAFQEVEDNLSSTRILAQQTVAQNQAAVKAREAVTLVINQYKSGTVDYSSVITAQIAAYTAEKSAADLMYQRMTATVGLIKSLGGGWKKYK